MFSRPSDSRLRHARAAFTLLELLVVMLILAMLAGTLAPLYGSRIESAREARCKQELKLIADAFHLHYEDLLRWPHDADLPASALSNQVLDFQDFRCMYSNVHAKPAWDGPYLEKGFKPAGASSMQVCGTAVGEGLRDPWDHPYQIVYVARGSSDAPFGAIIALSRGANGSVESSVSDLMNGAPAGDDLALVATNRL